MVNLLKTYTMYVYDDGSVVIKTEESSNISECSSSIRQIVKILRFVCFSKSKSGIRRRVSEGINSVAAEENINNSSVHAKITRKLGLSMEGFKDMVEEYFNEKSKELEETLINACVARTKQADEKAVQDLIKDMQSYIMSINTVK